MWKKGTTARGAIALAVAMLAGYVTVASGASAQILPGTTTTTQAPVAPSTTVPNNTQTTQPKLKGGGGDDAAGVKGVIPPGYQKIINSVKRSRPNNTTALLAAIKPLTENGLTQDQAVAMSFGRFPVGGQANFTDDWLNPRFSGAFHLHEGTDIFAPQGTPVRSPVDGVVRHASGGLGGTAAYVRTAEGHEVYFAHLWKYSDVKPGQTVKVGDVLGLVGSTGNAAGGAAHLHFEIHPRGKGPVNPKPYLDQWIAQALANVPIVIANYIGTIPKQQVVVPQELPTTIEHIAPPRAQLAWASSANPTGGALRLAEVEATVAAMKVDWTKRARVAEAERQHTAAADAQAKALLRPLTPKGLLDVLGLR